MIELVAPPRIAVGQPISVAYRADARLAGRVRLTSGTALVPFTLVREGREPSTGTTHRIRGKEGVFEIRDWGEHPAGTELVLRFEGAKVWMTVDADSQGA